MYLALLKLFSLILEAVDWIRFRALRFYASPVFQSGSGNVGERAAKLPLSDWRYPITVVMALIESVILSVWQVFKWLFFFNTRSIFEFFLSGVKIVIVLSVLSVVGLYGYLLGSPDPQILTHYKALHQQNTATALLGTDGAIIGAIPNPTANTEKKSPGSLYVEMVPPVYWDMLDYKTQRQVNFNYQDSNLIDVIFRRQKHYKGISLTSIFDSLNPLSVVEYPSLINNLATRLNGGEAYSSESCPSVLSDLCRTLSSIRLAKHAFPYLAQKNGGEFKRWTAIHGNVKGFANDISGLRAASNVIFNKKPEQLNNAEQALLAVAQLNQRPLLEVRNLTSLKDQAISIARELYATSQPALATNIERDLLQLSLDNTGNNAVNRRVSLTQRSDQTLGSFTDLIEQRVKEEYEAVGTQRIISDAQVTLRTKENEKFKQGLLSQFETLQSRCTGCGFNYKLGADIEAKGATIEVVVADQEGHIIRYFRRGELAERAVGSLSSIPAAVLLTSLGNRPDSLFCNQTYRNLPSSVAQFPNGLVNCQTPEQPGHALSFQQAIQVRASLPLFYALRKQASADDLASLYRNFGFTDLRTKAGNASHGEQLAYEMSYGVVQSQPLQQLDVIHQLGEVLYGRSQPKAIVGISQFLVSDLDEGKRYLEFNKSNSEIAISGNYLKTQNSRAAMRELLGYDINSKNAELKSLRDLKNIRFLLTKTGQSYTKQQALRDQWLVASVIIRGRRYAISAFVGSPTTDQAGLAKQLTAGQTFRPIMAEIMDSLD